MPLVLIVDDVATLAEQYAYDLNRIGGFDTRVATGGSAALEAVEAEPVDCIMLDLEMPGVDGFEVLRTLRKRDIPIPVIVYTGTGDYDRCIKAIRLGASSFIDKSESMERVVREVENALERRSLEAEIEGLKRDLGANTPLIGTSRAMKKLKEEIGRAARIPSPVLIVGESGTGKELVARELHRLAFDEKRPFIAINSAALPETLVESELFGHERGAFTGANRTRKGAFEQASGGTLFLDEIGELPTQMQAKLLRVLEEGQVTRVGGERTVPIDARVVAATNRNLDKEVKEGRFREDLLFRLNVHTLHVPPLRERRSDIRDLAMRLLESTCTRFGMRGKRLSPEALDKLMKHDWKRNNVRELKNVIERMVISTDADLIQAPDVPGDLAASLKPGSRSYKDLKAEAERQIIVAALERNDGHVSKTARELGLTDHASLLKIMRRHNITR